MSRPHSVAQRPSDPRPLQRARGRGAVFFAARGLRDLHQSGCAKILLPRSFHSVPEAVLVNTSGGVTGGDRLAWQAGTGAGAALVVGTQAAERIYRAATGAGRIDNTLTLGAQSRLEWLPQETLLFEGAALVRHLRVDMAADADFLGLEMLVLGRRAMGERPEHLHLHDSWRIRRDGRLVYADALRLAPPLSARQRGAATLDGAHALATLVHVGPEAVQRLATLRALLERHLPAGAVLGAASARDGVLVARFLARDARLLRNALVCVLKEYRGRDLPRVWHM